MAPNRRTGRQDIKKQTKNRFVSFDTDIGSHYDFEEAEPSTRGPTVSRQLQSIQRDISGQKARVSSQNMRAASGRRDKAYEVTMKNAGKFDISIVMETLNQLEEKVIPFNIVENVKKKLVKFFVCTQEEAENLKLLNRRLAHPSNFRDKFVIMYSQQPTPWDTLGTKLKLAIKDVVQSRHNSTTTNSIDLSNFQASKIFSDRDLRTLCSLSRTAVMVEVIRVISELFPGITGLSLRNNRLINLDYVQSFTFACKNVVELDLSDNSVEDVRELKKIRQWAIERVSLTNNPLCSSYYDSSSYTSAVQDYLPRISYLDGVSVNPDMNKVKADLRRRSGILYPPVQTCYFPDKAIRHRVEQLLIQFYEIYDQKPSDKSRQMLVDAYDENATFSHAVGALDEIEFKKFNRGVEKELSQQYLRSSRNICFENKWERFRERQVSKGPMAIAVALSQLPSTEHDKSLFLLEFLTTRQQLLIFTLRGIFRDGSNVQKSSGSFKFFTRTFIVVPRAEYKLAIVNDVLIISPISKECFDSYNDNLKKMSESSAESQSSLALSLDGLNVGGGDSQQAHVQSEPQQVAYDRNDPAVQQAMVEAFSQQSGMKPEWSKKCLEDTQWDFETAGRIFNELRGQIPADAFL